jgi:uncharacterized membrane protein
MLTLLLIRYIHPIVKELIEKLPVWLQNTLTIIIFIFIVLDLYVTIRHLMKSNNRLQELQTAINGHLIHYTKRIGYLKDSITAKFEESEFYSERIKALFTLNYIQDNRLSIAFPDLRSTKYNYAFQKLKSMLLHKDDYS